MTLSELKKAFQAKADQYNQLQAQATDLQNTLQKTAQELLKLQGGVEHHPDNQPKPLKKTENNHKQKGEVPSASRRGSFLRTGTREDK